MLPTNHIFHFPGMGESLLNAPDMGHPGMGHHDVAFRIVHTQVLLTQPVHQLVAIRSPQYFCESVLALWRMAAKSHRQQVQVVVAKNYHG